MTITNHLSHCIVCNKCLTGRQQKYCSNKCKSKHENPKNYDKNKHLQYQKKRGTERKTKLIIMSGGSCNKCGYNKCIASLSFHHLNPPDKLFHLDMASLCHRSWTSILSEYSKCQLLCLNCHTELHYLEHNAG